MAYDYGYGELGNKMIELFLSGAPDFEAAEALINQGADLNAIGGDDDENILSEILCGYWCTEHGDAISDTCDDRGQNRSSNPNLGASMYAIIRFFLNHGFDVTKRDDCFGAQCLWALALSTFDKYMIEATKILFDAGAKNRSVSPSSTDDDETPWGHIGSESHLQTAIYNNHALSNIYEAIYQIYQAIEDGKPYSGIDSYETAVGKKVLKVLAERNGAQPIFFPMSLPEFKRDHCYTQTLYLVYEGGVLISTQYADFWTDTILPDVELVDVSEFFEGIVGNTITNFAYDTKTVVKGNTNYTQPITTIEMDSGHKVRFSINFGEVKEEELAAFYELI